MDSFQTILYSVIAFNLAVALLLVYLVIKARVRQNATASVRRKQMLEQGKIISAQENLLKSKQDLLKEKEALLNEYRKMNE